MRNFMVVLGIILLVCPVVISQPYVVTTGMDGSLLCGELQEGNTYIQTIGIANPDTIQKDVVLSFAYYLESGTPVSQPVLMLYNGIDTLLQYGAVMHSYEQHGDTGVIVIRFANIEELPGGIPVSSDTITYVGLSFTMGYGLDENDIFHIDSSYSDTLGGWSFSGGGSPAWSGNVVYGIAAPIPNCCYMSITDCPVTPHTNNCYYQTLEHQFGWQDEGTEMPHFEIVSGPGTIDANSGLWTFTPRPSDAGQSYTVTVRVGEDWCGDGSYIRYGDSAVCSFTVDVAPENPPTFISGQKNKFVTQTGDNLVVSLLVQDDGPCYDYWYSYYISPQDPVPNGYLDTLTGEYYYQGTAADTGIYYISLVVSEGPDADTTSFYIYHFDTFICGDMNHNGDINVSDLTWLVNFLFNGGILPVTEQAGDVDCVPGVNVADITYLVTFLFQGGAAPCEGCPQ